MQGMRNQRIVCDMADRACYMAERPEAESVRSEARASALTPRKLPTPSIQPKSSHRPAARTRIALGKSNIGELKVQVGGLPILFRLLLDDGPTEMASGVVDSPADIRSLLSIALGKIVDQLRGSAKRGAGTPSEPALIIVEMGSNGEPVIGPPVAQTVLRVGPLNLNLLDRTAKRGDRQIDLRPREFQLLRYMMERSGKLLTRAELLRNVWHYKLVQQTNLVDVHMGLLRRKVDGPDEPPMIRSVRGAGFVMDACPPSPPPRRALPNKSAWKA
jgi:DNA-binding winged helix-turn-helix (wHTH) protein